MTSMERLRDLREEAQAFHTAYVTHFSSNLSEDRFNKFRLYFLNLINDELNDFFTSNYQMQLVMNTMQIGLNIWSEIQNEEGAKADIFNFFFVAACFIVVKLEKPDQIKRLKNWACYHEFNLNFVIWAERLILNKASWNLYINTPSESADIIFNEAFFYGLSEKNKESVHDLIKTWLQFALLEYSIYKKWDQTVITFASFYIGLSQHDAISKEAFRAFTAFIGSSNIVSLIEVKQCTESIMNLLQVSEECKKEEYDDLVMSPKFTRANSVYSLGEIFTQYEQCSLSLSQDKEQSEEMLIIALSNDNNNDANLNINLNNNESIIDFESNAQLQLNCCEEKPVNDYLRRKRKASMTLAESLSLLDN